MVSYSDFSLLMFATVPRLLQLAEGALVSYSDALADRGIML